MFYSNNHKTYQLPVSYFLFVVVKVIVADQSWINAFGFFLIRQCCNNAKQVVIVPIRDNVVDVAVFQPEYDMFEIFNQLRPVGERDTYGPKLKRAGLHNSLP